MILCLYVALQSSWIAPLFRRAPAANIPYAAVLAAALVMLTGWILPLLILLLDRRGPARSWYALMSFYAFITPLPVIIYAFVISMARRSVWTWPPPGVHLFPVMYVIFSAHTVRDLFPLRCPDCGRRALILVRSGFANVARSRTCASCGLRFDRLTQGDWKPVDSS